MCETPAGFIAAVPGSDRLFDLFDPFLQIAELIGTAGMAIRASGRMRMSASSLMAAISSETRLVPRGATIPNSPGQPRIRFANMVCCFTRSSRAVERQHGLLLGRLDCREPHRRATDHFANRFLIESIALATSHIWLDVPGRH